MKLFKREKSHGLGGYELPVEGRDAVNLRQFEKKVYKRNKISVRMLESPRKNRSKIYEMVFYPVQGWYPSKYASFTFMPGKEEISPEWYMDLFPVSYNPSIWMNKRNKLLSLRVPKDRQIEAQKILKENGFWFCRQDYLWHRRLDAKEE